MHLHYRTQGSASDEPIVLLHGWPDSGHSYSRVMPLISHRCRAIAPDLRGFGDSDKPETGYRIPDLAGDVVDLLDALGIERATVVGQWPRLLSGLLQLDDVEALARVACPTLLLWGDRDALFSRADQDQLLAALPNARLRVYDDTGHCPNWERPDAVAADLVGFLEATSAQGTPS